MWVGANILPSLSCSIRHAMIAQGSTRVFPNMIIRFIAALVLALLLTPAAFAAKCGGPFTSFIADFSREAAAKGISQDVLSAALGGVTDDAGVLAFDRRQHGTFTK